MLIYAAFLDGQWARLIGRPITDNPYLTDTDTKLRDAWNDGWNSPS